MIPISDSDSDLHADLALASAVGKDQKPDGVRAPDFEEHDHPCIVAFRSCGRNGEEHMVFATVDSLDRMTENAREVRKCVQLGLRVDKMLASQVRAAKWCDCVRGKRLLRANAGSREERKRA
jgi:hypothetical protein